MFWYASASTLKDGEGEILIESEVRKGRGIGQILTYTRVVGDRALHGEAAVMANREWHEGRLAGGAL